MLRRIVLAAAAGLALADGSIVTLGLPDVMRELDASVEQLAAVIGLYTLVLAVALPFVRTPKGGAAGAVLFAAGSAICGIANDIPVLLIGRGVQALGGAAVLVATFTALDAGTEGPGRRLWRLAAIVGAASGPALGGALTQAFDWRAIFLAQIPIALASAVALARTPMPETAERHEGRLEPGPTIALALASAALTAVLFLLVLLLVSGWSIEPLAAAIAVSVLPLAALAAGRLPGEPRTRAAAGCFLLAAGTLCLAWLPDASVAWTIVPQLLAGAGMGLALTALAGDLLPERDAAQAARLLAIRHIGITVALAILAPITSTQLDQAVEETRERGAAVILDADLPPLEKVPLAGDLLQDLDPVDARETVAAAFDGRPELSDLAAKADATVIDGVGDAFRPAFLITGGLALIAAIVLIPPPAARFAAAALLIPLVLALAHPKLAPESAEIKDPCQPRDLPGTGGLLGIAQDAALLALDRAACQFGSSREALVIALVDETYADDYEREYGVDPGSIGALARAVLGIR